MSVTERIVRFGPGGVLVGVLTQPVGFPDQAFARGAILLSAGLIHRVGPNRLYVKLARDLAALGIPVLRFDFAGMGDSPRRDDHLPIEKSVVADVEDALAFMQESVGVDSCVLIGHCSGAFLSCYMAQQATGVGSVIALNYTSPLAPDWTAFDREEKAARFYLRYYLNGALRSRTKWQRLLSGRVEYRRIGSNLVRGVLRGSLLSASTRLRSRIVARFGTVSPGAAPISGAVESSRGLDLDRMVDRGVEIAFVFSERNPGLEYVRASTTGRFDALVRAGHVSLTVIPASDHGFSSLSAQRLVRDAVQQIAVASRASVAAQHALG